MALTLLGHKTEDPEIIILPDPPPVPVDITPWMGRIRNFLGTKELLENGSVNPFITECFMHTTYHTKENEPWCAAFACKVLEDVGYQSTRDAGADSYINYGEKLADLKSGCIVVLQHRVGSLRGHYHVTFFVSKQGDTITCMGGNQFNSVCAEAFDLKYMMEIVAIRWPIKKVG